MIDTPSFKVMTFHCKGLTDPIKAKALHNWLKGINVHHDFFCLTEVKCSTFTLKANLQVVDKNRV